MLENEELFPGLDFSGLPDDEISKVLYAPPVIARRSARANELERKMGLRPSFSQGTCHMPESSVNGSNPDRKTMFS